MKQLKYIIIFSILLWSCNQSEEAEDDYGFADSFDAATVKIIPTDTPATAITIRVPEAIDEVHSSEIIEEVKYIPLETNKDALIGYYQKVIVYKGCIYILDCISAQAVLMYDMSGRFIKKLGTKGKGPEEFEGLAGMALDKKNNLLVLYDNLKREMKYYTLDGAFLFSKNVPYRFSGKYDILPSGTMVSATSKNHKNFHMGKWEEYRLLYSDTSGKMSGFGFGYNDNANISMAWSKIIPDGAGGLLYYPQYLNSLYTVTDKGIHAKYIFDCSRFSPFDQQKIPQFKSTEEFDKYAKQTTNLTSYIAENDRHLFFVINDKGQECACFYDKKTQHVISSKLFLYEEGFVADFPELQSSGEYFISKAPVILWRLMKDHSDKEKKPLPDSINNIIKKLKDDDNAVLVLFKLKQF